MMYGKIKYVLLLLMGFASFKATACQIKPIFTYSSIHTCGLPTIVTAVNKATGNKINLAKYWWKVNGIIYTDTIIGLDTAILYLKRTGTNSVRLFVKDSAGCIDSVNSNITVTSNAKTILDQNLVYSHSPIWMNCLQFIADPDSFRVRFESADTLQNLKIFWGDGLLDTSGSNVLPNTIQSHLYNSLGIFNIKIVTTNNACIDTVYGMVYNQRQPTAGIIGPPSGSNRGCVPHTLKISNNSYNISNNTKFLIDWGNGESQTEPHTKFKDSFNHTYYKGVCAGIIKITATNVCGSSFSTWNPIDISDKDKALWIVSSTCDPDSNFIFQNKSNDLYCLFPDIKEFYWDFGDGTNTGWINNKSSQNHNYKKEGDYTVTLIAKSTCGLDSFKSKVHVNYKPIAGFKYNNDRSCKPLIVVLTDTSKTIAYSRVWTIKEGNNVKTFTDSILVYSFTTPGNHTVELRITNICGSHSKSKSFVVNDKPKASFSNIVSQCIPVKVQFNNTSKSYFNNPVYTWDFGDSSTSSVKNPSDKTYPKPGKYTIKLIVSDTCGNDTFSQTFTAYSLPVASFISDSDACTFDSIAFNNQSQNANTYTWNFGDSLTNTTNQNGIFKHMYTASGTYIVRLIAGTNSGCKDSIYHSIIIKPGAKAMFDINQAFGCVPAAFKFQNKSIYGKDFKWFANDKLIATSSYLNDSILNSDTTIVRLKLLVSSAALCQIDSIEKVFFTPKHPNAHIFNNDSGCGPLSVIFNNQSKFYQSSLWDLGNGTITSINNPNTKYVSALTSDTFYYPKLIVKNWAACTDSASTRIKVFPAPKAHFTIIDNTGCGPFGIQFTNTSITNNSDSSNSLSHRWIFGDAFYDSSVHPYHVYKPSLVSDTFYKTKLVTRSINNCYDTFSKDIQIYPSPLVKFTPNKSEGCALLEVHFKNESTPNDTHTIQAMRFVWNSGNDKTDTLIDFSAVYNASMYGDTSYKVKLKAYTEHGCLDSSIFNITVHPQPVADFVLNQMDACTPMSIKTSNQSVTKDGGGLNHHWDFGNTFYSSLENDSSVYVNNSMTDQYFTIQYQAISQYGCKDTNSKTITVRPKPVAKFNVPNQSYCAPALIQLNDTSINAHTFYWGEGNTQFTGLANDLIVLKGLDHFDTTYVIQHQVNSIYGCLSDTAYKQVLVYGRPLAEFNTNKDSGCAYETIQFSNHSLGAYKYNWFFGDNQQSTEINPRHKYKINNSDNDTSFNALLVVSSIRNCKDSFFSDIYLVGRAKDLIIIDNPSGCTDLNVNLSHHSKRFKTSFWDFGDNSSYESTDSVTHTYFNSSGNLLFQPIIKLHRQRYNCVDTSISSVHVFPKPKANFIAKRNDPCDSGMYQFINQSINNTQNNWTINSNKNINLQSFAYQLKPAINSDSTYQIQLVVSNNYSCADTAKETILAKRKLKISFNQVLLNTCEKAPVVFTNSSQNGVRYFWKFGDGNISNDTDPIHTYLSFGSYRIVLYGYDKDGCIDSSDGKAIINVIESPIADFSYLPSFPKLPNALVNFKAIPTISTVNEDDLIYEWNFGDQSYPTFNKNIKDPSHLYTKSDQVAVTLKTYNQQCGNEVTKFIIIEEPSPILNFTPDTLSGCIPLKVKFSNNSENVNSYRWIFGDGSPDSYEKEPTHLFLFPGIWDVTLIASGPGGSNTLNKKYLITSHPKPYLNFYTNTPYMSLPKAIFNMTNLSNTVTNSWRVMDSLGQSVHFSLERDPSFNIENTGRYTVRLIGSNAFGCLDTLEKSNYLSTLGPGYVYVPNAFSPNNNSRNDGFSPILYNVMERNYTFKIFNRWGEKIFETNDLNGIWNGTYGGKDCNQDVYIWTVNGEYYNNDLFSFRGAVTLLK